MFREIASARSQIGPGIAQHIDQLKRHAVALAEGQHLVLAPACEVPNVSETEPRPELTYTTGDHIRVFVEIGSCRERASFLWIWEALQIEHLATRDFVEHHANVVAIRLLDVIEPIKTIRQALEQLSFALVRL